MEDIVSHRQIDCVPGNLCVEKYPGYTKCLADTDTSTNWGSIAVEYRYCLSNWGLQCTYDSQCCDPGTIYRSGFVPSMSTTELYVWALFESKRVFACIAHFSRFWKSFKGRNHAYSHTKLFEIISTFKYSF